MVMAAPQTILIIGGGLGGLAFAQILRYSLVADKYRVLIFERDATPTHRGQGYQLAINRAGLSCISTIPHIESVLHTEPKDYSVSMVDADLNIMMQVKRVPGPDGLAGLVNRWKLRNALAEGLDVQWGKRFLRYEEFETHVVAHFEDGTQATGDLLIGADGAKSRVRAQRCPELQLLNIPVLKAVASIAITPTLQAKIPRVIQLAEQHYLGRALAADGNTVMVMDYEAPDGERRLLWSYSFPAVTSPTLPTDPLKLKQVIDKRATVFGSELATMIHETAADDYAFSSNITAMAPVKGNPLARPLGATSRVTILGDAVHAMTSHRGLGANTAFADSRGLARALGNVDDVWGAVAEFEAAMVRRGFEAVRSSTQGSEFCHLVGWRSVVRDLMVRVLGWVLWAMQLVLG